MGFKPLSTCTTSVETLKHAWQDKQCWQSPIIRTGQGIVEDEDTYGSCSLAARYETEFVLTMGLHGWYGRTYVDWGLGKVLQHPNSFSSSFGQQTISFHPSPPAYPANNILADAIAVFGRICSEGVEGVRIVEFKEPG
jgi:hypothetical protein